MSRTSGELVYGTCFVAGENDEHLVVQVNRAALKWNRTTCGEGENYTVLLDVALGRYAASKASKS